MNENLSDNLFANVEKQWKKVFVFGAMAAFIVFAVTLIDVIIGSAISGDLSLLPQTAIERFSEFHNNWLLGLYHLDILNLIIYIVMAPVFFALFVYIGTQNLYLPGLF